MPHFSRKLPHSLKELGKIGTEIELKSSFSAKFMINLLKTLFPFLFCTCPSSRLRSIKENGWIEMEQDPMVLPAMSSTGLLSVEEL